MKRFLLACAAFACVAGLTAAGAVGGNGDLQCTGSFSGSAPHDLIVPANGLCIIDSAAIKHDLLVGQNAAVAVENTTIGHDLSATAPQNIETGFGGDNPGPVTIGHDLAISGSDAPNGIAYDVCDTSVGHDLTVTGTNVPFEIEIGDKGTELTEFCALAAQPTDTIGHDLVVSGNQAGRIDIGDNSVGHDLTVVGNTTTPATDVGDLDVSDNTVRHDASCSGNSSPPSKDGPDDGPNHTGGKNTCG